MKTKLYTVIRLEFSFFVYVELECCLCRCWSSPPDVIACLSASPLD